VNSSQQDSAIEVIDQQEQARHSQPFFTSQKTKSAIEPYVRKPRNSNTSTTNVVSNGSPTRQKSPRLSLHQQQSAEVYDKMKKNLFSRQIRSGSPVKSPTRAAGSGIGKGLNQLKK